MINLFLNNFAALLGSMFLSLNAHDPKMFSYQNLHWIVASICFISTIFVVFGMKEVIIKKNLDADYKFEQSNLVEKPSLKIVFKTSYQALKQKPELLLGIIGALCQVLIGRIGTAVTSLAAQYSFQKQCLDQDPDSECMVDQLNSAKDYIAFLAIAKTALTVSDVLIFGIALSYFEPLKFLSFTCLCMILAGSVMTSQSC